jgi:alpha-beta hydrolase superfamily lysophospholipase
VCHYTIADTPLGQHEAGAALLDGLDVYTIKALDDEHPLSVYGIDSSEHPVQADHEDVTPTKLFPVLLLHGRTWSSVPVYHLLGGTQSKNGQESRSLMETMRDHGLQPYAMDFRGFGGTPPDDAKCVEPLQCVRDAESVLRWIAARHGVNEERHAEMPAVLGWSQGALVAQLLAQKSPMAISKLILYGSLYDPKLRHPRLPLYTTGGHVNDNPAINTFDDVRTYSFSMCLLQWRRPLLVV